MGDKMNAKCETKWCRGEYVETSINDDRDGVLHCPKCGREIKRHSKKTGD